MSAALAVAAFVLAACTFAFVCIHDGFVRSARWRDEHLETDLDDGRDWHDAEL